MYANFLGRLQHSHFRHFIFYLAEIDFHAVIEYKNRAAQIFESDVAQVVASALAARPQYPKIKLAIVKTRTDRRVIQLGNDAELWSQIEPLYRLALRAKNGELLCEKNENPRKCAKCAMREAC